MNEQAPNVGSQKIEAFIQGLGPDEVQALMYDWGFWARENQLPPKGDWRTWMILGGRGFGKTRSGSEWVRSMVEAHSSPEPGHDPLRIGLVGPTFSDVRDVMIEGESGILNISPELHQPKWESTRRRLVWPNGCIATAFSADEPDRLRGHQFHAVWCDELAAWRYPQAWDMLMFCLRLGDKPQACVTTTPKNTKLVRDLAAHKTTHVTHGTTFDNADNLSPHFLDEIKSRYEGTMLGRQELYAQILTDDEGSLWSYQMLESARMRHKAPNYTRIIVAVDPAVTSNKTSDETGIIVAAKGEDGKYYILEDASCKKSPHKWAKDVVRIYHKYGADRVVAETNQGGDLVETLLRTEDPSVSYKSVRANRGKRLRAEPISALYEQGKVFHIKPFLTLEEQMVGYTQTTLKSPDRLDALVWALAELGEVKRSPFKVWNL